MRTVRRLTAAILLAVMLFGSLPSEAQADDIPGKMILTGVPAHPQSYSLSCESRAAVDWAGYWGIPISESEFLARLPRSDNPDAGFVGNPNDPWGSIPPASYGVHAGPVAEVLRQYGLDARAGSDLTWDDLRAQIAGGSPAIVWIIGQMWGGLPIEYETESGDTVTVARFEHTMILYGYDEWYAYVVDTYSGAYQVFSINTFLSSWSVLGNTAVISGSENTGKPSTPQTPVQNLPETYTVQRGDYLIGIAQKFSLAWEELASLNDLNYPYTLYAGQNLVLPSSPEEAEDAPAGEPYHIYLPLVWKPALPPPPAPAVKPGTNEIPAVYTVRQGDFLIQIARTYGLDWKILAEANAITWPFTVYPGQVLKLR
jgi:LysM repeat protein